MQSITNGLTRPPSLPPPRLPPGLLQVATQDHVEMAIDLFKQSTMDAVKSGISNYNIVGDPQVRARVCMCEGVWQHVCAPCEAGACMFAFIHGAGHAVS